MTKEELEKESAFYVEKSAFFVGFRVDANKPANKIQVVI